MGYAGSNLQRLLIHIINLHAVRWPLWPALTFARPIHNECGTQPHIR